MATNNRNNRNKGRSGDHGSAMDQLMALKDKLKEKGLVSDEQLEKAKKDNEARNRAAYSRRGGNSSEDKNFVPTPDIRGLIYGKDNDVKASTKPADVATAPYNFIPLPQEILPSELDDKLEGRLAADDGWKKELTKEAKEELSKLFHEFRYEGTRYSGQIELDIKALTPVFIGGNGEETFAPTGTPMIPGSSIRGMVKNLYHMITCGAWEKGENLTGQHLYYRCMIASGSDPQNKDLNDLYNKRMTNTEDEKTKKKAKPGFLVKIGSKYRIYPIINDKEHSIVIKEYMEKYKANISKSLVRWDGNIAYVQTGIIDEDQRANIKSKEEIEQFMNDTTKSKEERQKLGKQYYRYLNINEINKAKYYEVTDEVIEEYKNDKNRRGVDLLKERRNEKILGNMPAYVNGIQDLKYIVPCHYLLDNEDVTSFGHGQSFRVAYEHSVMDAVPAELSKPIVDFTSAVFGRSLGVASWASRVAFDDANLVSTRRTDEKAKARALMNPNPTAIQLYLEQNDDKKLVHWDNPNAKIRGYKMYWHNPKTEWKASQKEIEQIEGKRGGNKGDILKIMHPLLEGSEFKGAIRFRDMSAAELGALLKVFHVVGDQGKGAYKIGMGKSIGLGSIEIDTKLLLENGSRYTKFLDGTALNNSLTEEQDTGKFISAFEDYVKSNGREEDYKRIMESLSLMLDYKNSDLRYWNYAVSPITSPTNGKRNRDERFRRRAVLPQIKTVVERASGPIK